MPMQDSSIVHRLCPWHAAERHLIRLNAGERTTADRSSPLVPDRQGGVLTKAALVNLLRDVLQHVGIRVYIEADDGRHIPRFGGHSLRVSGAMMLAAARVPVHLIQLMGRWSSSAVERYTHWWHYLPCLPEFLDKKI